MFVFSFLDGVNKEDDHPIQKLRGGGRERERERETETERDLLYISSPKSPASYLHHIEQITRQLTTEYYYSRACLLRTI